MTSLSTERVAFARGRGAFAARERQLCDFIAALGVRPPAPPATGHAPQRLPSTAAASFLGSALDERGASSETL